jgi:hypothetical protein
LFAVDNSYQRAPILVGELAVGNLPISRSLVLDIGFLRMKMVVVEHEQTILRGRHDTGLDLIEKNA